MARMYLFRVGVFVLSEERGERRGEERRGTIRHMPCLAAVPMMLKGPGVPQCSPALSHVWRS